MEGVVWINGSLTDAQSASVSVFDRGLLYGDGLFETMRCEGGRVHLLERHLRRLVEGAAQIGIEVSDAAELRRAVHATLEAGGARRCIARLTLTRGQSPGGLGASGLQSTTIVTLRPLLQKRDAPAHARLATLDTPHPPTVTPTRIKTTSHLGFVLAAREVARRGVDEGVMLTREGLVAEGSVANLFIVKGDVVRTAPVSLGVLPGIARARVLELARELRITAREEVFGRADLQTCDAMFFTNAARGVVAVAEIDQRAIDASNEIVTRLRSAFDAEIADEEL